MRLWQGRHWLERDEAGRNLYVVGQAAGHSGVNTSSIYAKMDLEGLSDEMGKLDD